MVHTPRTHSVFSNLSHNITHNTIYTQRCRPPPSPAPLPISFLHPPSTLLRTFHASSRLSDFHFDTHHFVQRLEREGLNRAQAEGIMSAMAEVIDESVRNMTSNMVTKADQEKVTASFPVIFFHLHIHINTWLLWLMMMMMMMKWEPRKQTPRSLSLSHWKTIAPIHPTSRFCPTQI